MSLEENKLISVDVLRQATLVLALVICIGIAFSIILWAKEPDMRPLMADLRVADAVKIVDVLEQHGIDYRIDLAHHMLYIPEEDNQKARIALARVGVVIEYPDYQGRVIVPKRSDAELKAMPVYQQPMFMKIARLVTAAIVIIVLILVVMKPMLRKLIYPEDDWEEDGEDNNKDEKSPFL